MRFKGCLQFYRFFLLLLGTCLSSISAEQPKNTNQKNIDGQKLMAIRGLPLTHKSVADVMSFIEFKKIQTIRDDIHRVEINGVVQSHCIEITTHYLAEDTTIEIVVKETQAEDPVFSSKPYVDLIRIGLPRGGAAYPFAVPKTQGLTPTEAKEHLHRLAFKAERLFPYGITISMTPEQIHKLCDRPYAPGQGVIGKSGSGSIKFFEDPISPVPITVWFESGMVCGIDIHTWGPRSEIEDSEQAAPRGR